MRPHRSYPILIAIIALLALSLRFWGLERFPTLVFDEAHYVKFARQYLDYQSVFDAHPPLGKYFITLGMTFAQFLGQADSPIAYRWINALAGSLFVLVIGNLTYELNNHSDARQQHQTRLFVILASSFVALDGLLVVESRYALINIYLLLFGFLSHWLWLVSQRCSQARSQLVYQILAGISLGACICVKWNGIPFLLGLFFIEHPQQQRFTTIRQKLTTLGTITLIPVITYLLLWLPHLQLTPDSLWQIHQKMLQFHQGMDNTISTHPYCSPWYSWPLLQRPMAYWHEAKNNLTYTVHGLGNPILWWLSFAAIIALTFTCLSIFLPTQWRARPSLPESPPPIPTYLVINYALNWLPWALVGRCTFIYHYMSASVLSFIALAWLLSRWFTLPNRLWQIGASLMLVAIATTFLYFLPLALGLPLTLEALSQRWWLKSWI
jgi:dolichyl-phosphate-mannose-protein mannosyltransferase